jgi:hypothetical protein
MLPEDKRVAHLVGRTHFAFQGVLTFRAQIQFVCGILNVVPMDRTSFGACYAPLGTV